MSTESSGVAGSAPKKVSGSGDGPKPPASNSPSAGVETASAAGSTTADSGDVGTTAASGATGTKR